MSARQLREIAKYVGEKHARFVADAERKTSHASRTYGNAYVDESGYNHQLYLDANRAAEIVACLRRVKKERAKASRRLRRRSRAPRTG